MMPERYWERCGSIVSAMGKASAVMGPWFPGWFAFGGCLFWIVMIYVMALWLCFKVALWVAIVMVLWVALVGVAGTGVVVGMVERRHA